MLPPKSIDKVSGFFYIKLEQLTKRYNMSTFLFVLLIIGCVFTAFSIFQCIFSDDEDVPTKFIGGIIRLTLMILACVFGGTWAFVIGIIFGAVGCGLSVIDSAIKQHPVRCIISLVMMILFIVALANN